MIACTIPRGAISRLFQASSRRGAVSHPYRRAELTDLVARLDSSSIGEASHRVAACGHVDDLPSRGTNS